MIEVIDDGLTTDILLKTVAELFEQMPKHPYSPGPYCFFGLRNNAKLVPIRALIYYPNRKSLRLAISHRKLRVRKKNINRFLRWTERQGMI